MKTRLPSRFFIVLGPEGPQDGPLKGEVLFFTGRANLFAHLSRGSHIYEITSEPRKPEDDVEKAPPIAYTLIGEWRDPEVIKKLVGWGANVNAGEGYLLKWACANDRLDVVKILVEKGADFTVLEDQDLPLASQIATYIKGPLNLATYLKKEPNPNE